MNYKRTHLDDEDDFEGITSGMKILPYAVKSRVSNIFMFKLDEGITDASYYRNITDVCNQAGDEDQIHFYINSPGGLLSGLSTILDAIEKTDALTVAIVTGDCHSAASIIMLHCDVVDVGRMANALCHNVSFGTSGRASDIQAQVNHTTKQATRLLKETYEGFMSESEIDLLLEGKQFYFDAEEIVTRLEARDEYRDAVVEAMKEEALQEASSPVPKPSKKTTKPKE